MTRTKQLIGLILALSTLLFYTPLAYANTSATDNFDSYTNGASLPTLNGGSGWSAAWANDGNCSNTITNAQSDSASNSTTATNEGGTDQKCRRSFSGAATGEYKLAIRLGANNNINYDVSLGNNSTCTDASSAAFIRFNESGNAIMFSSSFGSSQTIAAYSTNTWYWLYIKWDGTNYQTSLVTSGSAASYGTAQVYNNAEASLNYICIHYSSNFTNAANVWVDTFAPVSGAVTAVADFGTLIFFGHW